MFTAERVKQEKEVGSELVPNDRQSNYLNWTEIAFWGFKAQTGWRAAAIESLPLKVINNETRRGKNNSFNWFPEAQIEGNKMSITLWNIAVQVWLQAAHNSITAAEWSSENLFCIEKEKNPSIHLRYTETIHKMIQTTKHVVGGIITAGAEFHRHSGDISEITHHFDLQVTQWSWVEKQRARLMVNDQEPIRERHWF